MAMATIPQGKVAWTPVKACVNPGGNYYLSILA
jgi:hypothetical protein